jgi:hypothetical protein
MTRRRFQLVHQIARDRAKAAIAEAPLGTVVTLSEATKSRDQENHYHALIADIACSCLLDGERMSDEDWKRVLVHMFANIKETEGDPLQGHGRLVRSPDGVGVVQLGVQTRTFSKRHAAEFIDFLFAFGAEHNVEWSESREALER